MSNQVSPQNLHPEPTLNVEDATQPSDRPPPPVDPLRTVTDDEEISCGFSAGDRRFMLISCLLILGLIVANLIRLNWIGPPQLVLKKSDLYQVDINDAGWVEWMQLPGIGETTARNIVADRDSKGPFTSIDDVMRVKGIGPATFKAIQPYLRFRKLQDE